MPVSPTFPGVYIDEVASAVHTITGVPTSDRRVRRLGRSRPDRPPRCTSPASPTSSASSVASPRAARWATPSTSSTPTGAARPRSSALVRTGDTDATKNAKASTIGAATARPTVPLVARGEGAWGDNLRVRVDYATTSTARQRGPARLQPGGLRRRHRRRGAVPATSARRPTTRTPWTRVLARSGAGHGPAAPVPVLNVVPERARRHPPGRPRPGPVRRGQDGPLHRRRRGGADGVRAHRRATTRAAATGQADKKGIYQLLKTDIFNMLCLPGRADHGAVPPRPPSCASTGGRC